jgi:hypothetical protein
MEEMIEHFFKWGKVMSENVKGIAKATWMLKTHRSTR